MKTNGRPVMIYTKFIFPLLLLLFSLKFCFAFEFLEDTVNVTKIVNIHTLNDSSHEITIDSIKIILLEGSISNQIYFNAVDTPMSYSSTPITVKGPINKKNDSIFYAGNYSGIKIKMPANIKGLIYDFEIGECVGNQLALNQNNNSFNNTVSDYIVKLVFYASDNSSDYVVLKGILSTCTSILRGSNSTAHTLCKMNKWEYVNLLGRKTDESGTGSVENGIITITQNQNKKKRSIGSNILINYYYFKEMRK